MLMSDVNLKSYSDTSYHNEELKSLTRYRFDKVKERAKHVANAHLSRLTNLLIESSKGRYGKETAITFREAARASIGSNMPAKSLELRHTIKLIQEPDSEINEISSPILSIPGINYRMGAMIIAEIGDFSHFDSPDIILACAGLSPSIYQSSLNLTNSILLFYAPITMLFLSCSFQCSKNSN